MTTTAAPKKTIFTADPYGETTVRGDISLGWLVIIGHMLGLEGDLEHMGIQALNMAIREAFHKIYMTDDKIKTMAKTLRNKGFTLETKGFDVLTKEIGYYIWKKIIPITFVAKQISNSQHAKVMAIMKESNPDIIKGTQQDIVRSVMQATVDLTF